MHHQSALIVVLKGLSFSFIQPFVQPWLATQAAQLSQLCYHLAF
jgi:hypothetical protein